MRIYVYIYIYMYIYIHIYHGIICIYIYIYTHMNIHNMSGPHGAAHGRKPAAGAEVLVLLSSSLSSLLLRPVRLLRVMVSEGLTQANS